MSEKYEIDPKCHKSLEMVKVDQKNEIKPRTSPWPHFSNLGFESAHLPSFYRKCDYMVKSNSKSDQIVIEMIKQILK